MVYNGNVRCRGVQVLSRRGDTLESTSPILVMNDGRINMGSIYSIDMHRELSGIVAQGDSTKPHH